MEWGKEARKEGGESGRWRWSRKEEGEGEGEREGESKEREERKKGNFKEEMGRPLR